MIALAVPLAICLLVLIGPWLLARAQRSRSLRIALAAATLARLLRLGRQGLAVFANPRHGVAAVSAPAAGVGAAVAGLLRGAARARPAIARGLAAAAAVLLAVNVSAVLPATPSNVGVFQAACLVVLAAYGVGAGPAPRLRDHPAGRRGPHRARPRHPRAARRGHDLARHPWRRALENEESAEPAPAVDDIEQAEIG